MREKAERKLQLWVAIAKENCIILSVAAIAQLVERLIRNQQVGSPILLGGTILDSLGMA